VRRWPWSTGDHVNTWPIAALTQAVKPDIGSESRFLPTPPAFKVPVRGGGLSVGISPSYLVWKTRMVWLPDGEKILMTECTNMTDRQTHAQTPHDGIGSTCIASCGKNCRKLCILFFYDECLNCEKLTFHEQHE